MCAPKNGEEASLRVKEGKNYSLRFGSRTVLGPDRLVAILGRRVCRGGRRRRRRRWRRFIVDGPSRDEPLERLELCRELADLLAATVHHVVDQPFRVRLSDYRGGSQARENDRGDADNECLSTRRVFPRRGTRENELTLRMYSKNSKQALPNRLSLSCSATAVSTTQRTRSCLTRNRL